MWRISTKDSMPASEESNNPKRVYRATGAFWRAFDKIEARQQALARAKFEVFKENPFQPSLKSHRINKLSAQWKRTIFSACLEGDLRVIFYIEGNEVISVGIGTHSIYR